MMKIPCHECISFAICKHQKHIKCSLVWEVLWVDSATSHEALFKEISKVLPKSITVEKDGFGIVVHKYAPHYTFKNYR